MKKQSVRKRIFWSNAIMVLVTLLIFLIINICVIEIYADSIEADLMMSVQNVQDKNSLENFVEDWTIHRNEFILYFLIDGLLCIGVLIMISLRFTRNLTNHIMEPLLALAEGAKRVRSNDLSQNVEYQGEYEFENVCDAFNDMQKHILEEQEKNRKYEKARTDMIAGISHDLRTPLTAIKGTVKALLDGIVDTPEKQKKFLHTAYKRTGDMDVLLNQLLYLSKIETGNVPFVLHKIEISQFIRNYVTGKQEFLDSSKEELLFLNNDICMDVVIDAEQMQRIFDNLLENCRKYCEKDFITMKIELARTQDGVQICFRDNGIGVPEDKLPFLFDEFYRADESRNKKEGNGLGLYIVKYLVEQMAGIVYAKSEDGFAVYMELKKA